MSRKLARIVCIVLLTLATGIAHAQSPPWTGVLNSSRAIDWSQAGAGAIPARATICSTVALSPGAANAPVNGAAIRSAISGCTAGETVKLPSGTWYVDYIAWGTYPAVVNNVTLRGAGANSTFLIFTSGAGCNGLGADVCMLNGDNNYSGSPENTASWTAGYAKGATSITLNSVSGNAPNVGTVLILDQLDTTFTGGDTGNIFVCQSSGSNGDCSQQGGVGNGRPGPSGCMSGCRAQNQLVTVTAVSGSGTGPYTVTISPGLYASNWNAGTGAAPGAWWSGQPPITGDGIESMSLDHSNTGISGAGIMICNGYKNWVKDVRGVDTTGQIHKHVWLYQANNNTVRDSYFYGSNGSSESYGVDSGASTGDNLVENNICQHVSTCEITEGSSGTVFAYNFAIDNYYNGGGSAPQWQQEDQYHHSVGDNFQLYEGNEGIGYTLDDIHGTSFMNTMFRVFLNGRDPALTSGLPKNQQTAAASLMAYSREMNMIGNVLGTPGYHTNYTAAASSSTDCGSGNANVSIFVLGYSGDQGTCFNSGFTIPDDTLVAGTLMRWGNYDVVNATPQFNSGEVPSGLSIFANAVPSSHTLPASFFMSGSTAPIWYTTSSGDQLLYPAVGPDVSSGNISGYNGYANLTPAADCALNIMGINPNGSSGAEAFDAYSGSGSCGYGSPSGTPSVTFSTTAFGTPVTSYTWTPAVVLGSGSAYETIYVNNTGTGTLNITLPISFTTGTDFVFVSNECGSTGGVVAPGASCYMQMQFVPTVTGTRTDTIVFTDNAGSQTFTVNGTGTGSLPPPNPSSNLMFILASANPPETKTTKPTPASAATH